MYRIAVYGKGGIGKSTVSANISYGLSLRGYSVLHVGAIRNMTPLASSPVAGASHVSLTTQGTCVW